MVRQFYLLCNLIFLLTFLGVNSIEGILFSSSTCFSLPETDVCSSSLNFIWPARAEGRSCVCPVHNSSAGRLVFESCVEGCSNAVVTPTLTKNGRLCVPHESRSLQFHFVCSTEPCGDTNPCFVQTIIATSAFIDMDDNVKTKPPLNSTETTNILITSTHGMLIQ